LGSSLPGRCVRESIALNRLLPSCARDKPIAEFCGVFSGAAARRVEWVR
jgi:hypothetical protein